MLEFAVRPLSALDAIFTRRSVRSFSTQKLEPSTVHSLLDAAIQAPTGAPRETVKKL
jgi:nitroreductase